MKIYPIWCPLEPGESDPAFVEGFRAPVSLRAEPIEPRLHAINSKLPHAFFARYRDFPDEHRVRGQESC